MLTVIVCCNCSDSPAEPPDPSNPGCIVNGVNTCNDKPVEITVRINEDAQTIRHFGASDGWSTEFIGENWPQDKKEKIARLLFSTKLKEDGSPEGIGLSLWRFNIGSGSADMEDSGFEPSSWFHETECFMNEDGSYDWNRQAGSLWFMQKAKDYGVDQFTGWLMSPPYFMTQSGYTFRTNDVQRYNLAPGKYDDYANFLANVANHFAGMGLPFTDISPINEPQWAWQNEPGKAKQGGSYGTNEEMANLVTVIDSTFRKNNVDSKVMISEAGSIEYLYQSINKDPQTSDQIQAFWNASSDTYIGDLPHLSHNVAGHSYWTNSSVPVSINDRQNLLAKLKQTNSDLRYWETEYSLLGSAYLEGRDRAQLQPIDYSLWIARIIYYDLIQADCTGWSFWTSLTYKNSGNRFGLLEWYPDVEDATTSDGTIKITKNLWALGNYSRFIRPGMVRIPVDNVTFPTPEEEASQLMVSAFKDPSGEKVVLVCINYTSSDKKVTIKNLGDDFDIEGGFSSYTTSSTKDLEYGMINPDKIEIPQKSIVTLVGSLK